MSEFNPLSSLYADNTHFIHQLASVDESVLKSRQTSYSEFLEGDIMPRARDQATRVLAHIAFELDYRAGRYSKSVDCIELTQVESELSEIS